VIGQPDDRGQKVGQGQTNAGASGASAVKSQLEFDVGQVKLAPIVDWITKDNAGAALVIGDGTQDRNCLSVSEAGTDQFDSQMDRADSTLNIC
jgi:hypothetical protein